MNYTFFLDSTIFSRLTRITMNSLSPVNLLWILDVFREITLNLVTLTRIYNFLRKLIIYYENFMYLLFFSQIQYHFFIF